MGIFIDIPLSPLKAITPSNIGEAKSNRNKPRLEKPQAEFLVFAHGSMAIVEVDSHKEESLV
jgi:hypothetical protein